MSKSQVYLFIYDQSSSFALFSGSQKSYHAGISLYGKEYCYTKEGILTVEHSTTFNGSPLVRPFTLGMTDVTEPDFLNRIDNLKSTEFETSKYDAENNNSCHFARQLIKFLLEIEKLEPELEEYLNQSFSSSNTSWCILS